MAGTTSSAEGFLKDLPLPLLTKISGEPTIEALIKLYRIIRGNAASVASNLRGGRHGHMALTMATKDYTEQTGYAFVPLHNTGNYPATMGTAQEQALETERFRQNQSLFII